MRHLHRTSRIERFEFSLIDPLKLKKVSVVEITSADMWEMNTPVKGGLFDLRTGTIDRRYVCQTCKQKENNCPGHLSYIQLTKPCFIPNMIDHVMKVLKCVCPNCSALLIAPEDVKVKSLAWVAEEVTKRAAYRFCKQGHPTAFDDLDSISLSDDSSNDNEATDQIAGCGAHRALYTKADGLHIKGVFFEQIEVPEDEAEEETPSNKRKRSTRKPKKPKFEKREMLVTAEKAYKILRKISPEHAELMGFGPGQHPCWMIWTVLPVVPPPERPSIQMSPTRRGEDDLTYTLFNIIKANQELTRKIIDGCHASQLSPSYDLLQYRVGTYTTNAMQNQPKAKMRSGRESQGVVQKLKGKEGLVRQNQMGKRVNFSGRSVITGDPSISVNQVGLPREMAMTLTKPIPVTAENMDECWERVLKGPHEYGGANSIIKWIRGRKYVVDLNITRDRGEITLRKGMIVERHIEDGDWVIFNRQPTLHRVGMMGHEVVVVPSSTLRQHPATTTPYNSDFDGDEMNIHVPQSQRAEAEVKHLAAVQLHIRSAKNGGATIGLVQDALLAGYLLSLDGVLINREVFFDCVMSMKHAWSQDIPDPVGEDVDGRPVWTGKQLLSMAIPSELNLHRGKTRIIKGVLVEGTLDKGLLGAGSGSLLHLVVHEFGEQRARDFLDNLHDVCLRWLLHRGFTFSARDVTIPKHLREQFHQIVYDAEKEVDEYIKAVTDQSGKLKVSAEHAENMINQKLNQAISKAGKEVLPALPRSNLTDMATGSRSKGKKSNIIQMVGYVGQQNVNGGRIPCGMLERTLPHFPRGDISLKSRGWVSSPYVDGLSPSEYFFHTVAGREGLVDTAIKSVTAETQIIVLEDGVSKRVEIGPWIDSLLAASTDEVEHYEKLEMEVLNTAQRKLLIPTMDLDGNVSWGEITAVTRHDPGDRLFRMKTLGGREVIVTEAKSVMIYDEDADQFVRVNGDAVKVGDNMPVTQFLPAPPQTHGTYEDGVKAFETWRETRSLPPCVYSVSYDFVRGFISTLKTQESIQCADNAQAFDIQFLLSRAGHFLFIDGSTLRRVTPWRFLNDAVLDRIVSIEEVDVSKHPKVYDLTVPSTLNFCLANGLHVVDTAKTGYALRQITNACSDLTLDQLFLVRNSKGSIVQFYYGGDLVDPTKVRSVRLDYNSITLERFEELYRHSEETMTRDDLDGVLSDEWDTLLEELRYVQQLATLPKGMIAYIPDGHIYLPVDIDQLLLDAQVKFGCGKFAAGADDLQIIHPAVIVEEVNRLMIKIMEVWAFDEALVTDRVFATTMLRIAIRSRLASKRIINEYGLSQQALQWVCDRVIEDYQLAIAHPGEAVGMLAAQSNGEPQQQMTLNTFHFAGISSQNVTLGVPRINEIIHCTRSPKHVSTKIHFDNGDLTEDEQFKQAWSKKGEIEEMLVRDALSAWDVIHDPNPEETTVAADRLMVKLHHLIYPDEVTHTQSAHVIRLVFDPVKLAQHHTNFAGVVAILREVLGDGQTVSFIHSDMDAKQPVVRIRAIFAGRSPERDSEDASIRKRWRKMEEALMLRFFRQQVSQIRLSGVEDVRNVSIILDELEGRIALDTDCRKLHEALRIDGIKRDRVECDHPYEVNRHLGIEAARNAIILEIRKVYMLYGLNVNSRHLSILADAMTASGSLMSIDRHGINRAEFNTLKKAAFEEIDDVLTRAAVSGTIDPLCDNTSRIMTGQEINVGTGIIDLFLDRNTHEKLSRENMGNYQERARKRRQQRAIDARSRAIGQLLDRLKEENARRHDLPSDLPSVALAPEEPQQTSGMMLFDDDDDDDDVFGAQQEYEREYDPAAPFENEPSLYNPEPYGGYNPEVYDPSDPMGGGMYNPEPYGYNPEVYDPSSVYNPEPYDPTATMGYDPNAEGLYDPAAAPYEPANHAPSLPMVFGINGPQENSLEDDEYEW